MMVLPLLTAAVLAAAPAPVNDSSGKWMKAAEAGKDLYATLKTTQGDIVVKLFSKQAPLAVSNFVGLATGEKPWRNSETGEQVTKPMYNGVTFHRVIRGFMIQGGDPTGTGRGDPGYTFANENPSARFDRPGLLAMANRGRDTNGCQFFITVATPQYLNGNYTIFGEVISGYPNVVKISEVKTDRSDRPVQDVKIDSVTVSDKAPKTVGKKTGKGAKAASAKQ